MENSALNIVMYSQDGRGLGRTTRTLQIASYLSRHLPNVSILLLTDLSMVGRLKVPDRVDFVHLPGVVLENGLAHTQNLNLESHSALKIRRKITKTAVKTFKPQWIIIDRDPLFLPEEVKRTFSFVPKRLPQTRVAWCMPDVLGEPELVRKVFKENNVYKVLKKVAHEVWVFGCQEIFDHGKAYAYPKELKQKVRYMGYLRAQEARSVTPPAMGEGASGEPFILVAAGSGVRGYELLDAYLRLLETEPRPWPLRSVIVSGPMMDPEQKHEIKARCEKLPDVEFHRFSKHLLRYIREARLVVGTGGFNMICETLSYRKSALFVPDAANFKEHLYRVNLLASRGLAEFLPPDELTPQRLKQAISRLLDGTEQSFAHLPTSGLRQDALENILQRILENQNAPQQTREGKQSSGVDCPASALSGETLK